MKTIAFRTDDELARQIKMYAAQQGISIQKYVTDLILTDMKQWKGAKVEIDDRQSENSGTDEG